MKTHVLAKAEHALNMLNHNLYAISLHIGRRQASLVTNGILCCCYLDGIRNI